ncbi:MAG: STAS/SEC14 domain-containing protein [Myxococcota bacterium]|nr:STAS/SEC14 domain-containing protein [Myxococcota bacterium]
MAIAPDKNWIQHKSHKVLFRDYRNLMGKELVDKIFSYHAHTSSLTEKNILMVIDVSQAYVDREVLGAFKKVAAANKSKVKKTAVIGLEGVQRVFLDVIVRFSSTNIRSFNAMEEALAWLIED